LRPLGGPQDRSGSPRSQWLPKIAVAPLKKGDFKTLAPPFFKGGWGGSKTLKIRPSPSLQIAGTKLNQTTDLDLSKLAPALNRDEKDLPE
jgi:hypothetical protein